MRPLVLSDLQFFGIYQSPNLLEIRLPKGTMQIAIILYQFKIQNFELDHHCKESIELRIFFFWPVFFRTRAELGPDKSPYLYTFHLVHKKVEIGSISYLSHFNILVLTPRYPSLPQPEMQLTIAKELDDFHNLRDSNLLEVG